MLLNAQRFGGIPAGMQWKQINTASVKVVFPEGMDSVANRVATVTDYLNQYHQGTVGYMHQPISIVLQRDLNLSNAYVGLGPWRSEFYMMPPQNPFTLGSLSWADNLAVHEFRHVQQFSNYRVGLSKVMGFLGGQNGRALANAAAVPDWFFEGDAVWNETVLTNQGRGRLPLFLSAYQTIYRDNRKYSFMKMRNGSLQQYVPNHYDLGYLLVSFGRQQYGDSMWTAIAKDAAAYKMPIYPLQAAFKKHIGLKYKDFIEQAMEDFKAKWQSKASSQQPEWLTGVSSRNVFNYQYPYPAGNGQMVVLKTAYNQIPTFVAIDTNGIEKSIAIKHISYDDYYSYKNGRIVYAALETDKRWDNRDYSIIKLLDVQTGNTSNLTSRSRYFSPDISEDGEKLVAVKMQPGKASLVALLNASGQELATFTIDSSLVYSHPKFLANGSNIVVAARQANGEMGWLIWEPASNETRWLLPLANRTVGFPVVQQKTLIYSATEGLQDALFAIDLTTGQRKLMANYPTGVYQGFLRNGMVTATFFTAGGFRLGRTEPIGAALLQGTPGFVPLYPGTGGQQATDIAQLPTKKFDATRYRQSLKLFNFHSWQPELNEPDYTLRVLGNNVLNTTLTDLFYTFNTNEHSHAAGLNFVYGGWYLQPTAGIKQTWGREIIYNADTTFIYNETEASAGVRLPFNFSGGKQFRYLTLSSSVAANTVNWQGIGKGLLRNQDFTYLINRLVYTGQIQKARQHIYPRLAQSLVVDYRRMIDEHQSWQLLMSGMVYLPGLSTNHNLVISAAWQARDTLRQYTFSNSFPFSRGYRGANFPRMWRIGANYHFPFAYPDWGLANVLYLLRLRANIFYDYSQVKSLRTQTTRPFRSTGIEMFADTRIWNQIPVSIGLRYSRLLDFELTGATQPNQWEIVLPINLF